MSCVFVKVTGSASLAVCQDENAPVAMMQASGQNVVFCPCSQDEVLWRRQGALASSALDCAACAHATLPTVVKGRAITSTTHFRIPRKPRPVEWSCCRF